MHLWFNSLKQFFLVLFSTMEEKAHSQKLKVGGASRKEKEKEKKKLTHWFIQSFA